MAGLFGAINPATDTFDANEEALSSQAALGARLGPSYAIGMMAGRGVGQALEGLGLPNEARYKEQRMKQFMQESRDPNGDMEKTYETLAQKLTAAGLLEEAYQAKKMLQDYQTKKEELSLKRMDIESKVEERDAKLAIRQALVDAKLAGKPWAEAAIKFYQAKAPQYTTESWNKWWKKMEETKGDWTQASAALEQYEKDTGEWGPEFRDADGNWVQRSKRTGEVRAINKAPKVDVRLGGPNVTLNNANELGDYVSLQKRFDEIVNPWNNILDGTTQAFSMLKTARTGNTQASEMLRQQLAKIFKADSQLASREIERMRTTGPLGERLAARMNDFINGVPTQFQLDEMEMMLRSVAANARTQRDQVISSFKAQASRYKTKDGKPIFDKQALDDITGGARYQTNQPDLEGNKGSSKEVDDLVSKYRSK